MVALACVFNGGPLLAEPQIDAPSSGEPPDQVWRLKRDPGWSADAQSMGVPYNNSTDRSLDWAVVCATVSCRPNSPAGGVNDRHCRARVRLLRRHGAVSGAHGRLRAGSFGFSFLDCGTRMDVGLGLWTLRSTAAIPANTAAMHAEFADQARWIERLGFHSLWVAEHHFWYDGWTPAPLITAAAALAATERLHVGTGIHLLPLADPVVAGREIESLHRLSGGRFEYGVGLGYRAAEYDGFGLSRRVRGKRMDVALDYLLARSGVRGDAGPTIWVGGFAEAAIKRTASRGLAALLPSTLSANQIGRTIDQFRSEAELAGEPPGKIGVMKYTWIVESAPERERAEALHAAVTREYTGSWFSLRGRPGFESPDLVDGQVRRAMDTGLIGTTEDILGQLRELRDAGVDMVVLHLLGDGRAPRTREVIERLAENVLQTVST